MIMWLANPAHATEDNVTAPSQDEATPVPTAIPVATVETIGPPKQSASNQQAINLETAYKREYAFLEAQKRELAQRLSRYQSNTKKEEQALNNRINVLERSSIERSAKIDQLNSQLFEAERTGAAVEERVDTLEITYSQAEAALKSHGIETPATLMDEVGNDPTKVEYLFKEALSLIDRMGAIQTKAGVFFLENIQRLILTFLLNNNLLQFLNMVFHLITKHHF